MGHERFPKKTQSQSETPTQIKSYEIPVALKGPLREHGFRTIAETKCLVDLFASFRNLGFETQTLAAIADRKMILKNWIPIPNGSTKLEV